MTRYFELPTSVLSALVTAIGNFDMDRAERVEAASRLRYLVVDEISVYCQVTDACESVRRDRDNELTQYLLPV